MLARLLKEQRPLVAAGIVSMVMFIAMTVLTQVDGTQILSINRWIKPMKFYFSIAIFVWTVALFLDHLKGYQRFSRFVSWAMILIFIGEMAGVTGQAARGTTSHFNIASPADSVVYAVMGLLIIASTLLVAAIAVLYFRTEIDLPPTVLLAMRLGLVVFLAGSLQGGYMSSQVGHTVGAADGGPGLPLTNWSTIAGDLRVAHFMGLHSLQAIPIVGVVLERYDIGNRLILTVCFAAAYFGLSMLMFIQALLGRPLIAL